MHTQRQQIQLWSVFLSNLAGSIIGLLGTIGFLMNQFEGYYESYLANRKDSLNFKELKKRRIEIIDKNLYICETRDFKIENPQVSSRELISYTDLSIKTNNSPCYSNYLNT